MCIPDGSDVLRGGAAAASQGIDKVLLAEGADLLSHLGALLVVAAHGIGQPSIGVAEDVAVRTLAQVLHIPASASRASAPRSSVFACRLQSHACGVSYLHTMLQDLVTCSCVER